MIKVDRSPDVSLPPVQEIWVITRRENALTQKSTRELCREKFGKDPVYVYEDMSLRVDYIGINP